MKSNIWFEVERFVRTELGVSPYRHITPPTRLGADLGLTGSDAGDFMDRFFSRFEVEPGDFRVDRYFLSVGARLMLLLTVFTKARASRHRAPLTVGMLASAARQGRWESKTLEGLHRQWSGRNAGA